MNKKVILGLLIGFACIIGFTYFYTNTVSKPYVVFAQCIEKSGAKFYGAYWCPHCQKQKSWFKGGKNALPYVECALQPNESASITASVMAEYNKGTYTGPYLVQIKEVLAKGTKWEATQALACVEKKIKGYPTWIYGDGVTESGEKEFSELAKKTGCTEPK